MYSFVNPQSSKGVALDVAVKAHRVVRYEFHAPFKPQIFSIGDSAIVWQKRKLFTKKIQSIKRAVFSRPECGFKA